MANGGATKRLALLIDGDNVPAALADTLFAEVARFGSIALQRVYAGTSGISDWRDKAKAYCIGLRETMPGKNSTDMELAVDAMDLLHRGRLDGYCIASSDSDFAPLARRLREDGVMVNGFGESKAADGVRRAFDSFIELKKPDKAARKATKSSGGAAALLPAQKPEPIEPKIGTREEAERLVLKALGVLEAGGAWTAIETVHQQILKLDRKFKPKVYGFSKLSALVDAIACMETKTEGKSVKMRMKAKTAPAAKAA